MSAFNVGKKVSAAVRILQRKRDASARATHLVGKKYPLITYEKALLSQATGGKFPSVTFIERKQMSTKTSIKRIALVAAAALTLGGFSVITAGSASAAAIVGATSLNGSAMGWSVIQAYAGASTAQSGHDVNNGTGLSTSGTQTVGGIATLKFTGAETATATALQVISSVTSSGVGTIGSASVLVGVATGAGENPVLTPGGVIAPSGATTGTVTWPTTAISFAGTPVLSTRYLDAVTVNVSSAVAGTQTLTYQTYAADGSASTSYTATITWVGGTAAGANAAQSSFYVVPAGTPCVYGTSKTTDMTSTSALLAIKSNVTGSLPNVCLSVRDASGNAVTTKAVTVFGTLGGTAPVTTPTTGGHTAAAMTTNSTTGLSTINAIVTDIYGNVITLTAPLTYYGSLKTLSLDNLTYSAYYKGTTVVPTAGGLYNSYGTGATGDVGTPSSGVGGLILVGKDSNGAQIDLAANANGTGATFMIDSDATAGPASAKSSDALGDAITTANNATAGKDVAKLGGNALYITCGAVKAEKLSIVAYGTDSNGATVTSNAVTFYCSSTAKTVAVTAASSSVDAGGTTTVTATATDASGYPVADGTSVTFAATGAGAVAPASSTTVNGVAGTTDSNLVNFIANGDGGAATVTAIAGNYSASTSISVAGGSGAASLSLDAANAATDAANNAYDEAQNATQAASDALAAVTALSAQVGALIATVKSLAAVVAKIKAKVKA